MKKTLIFKLDGKEDLKKIRIAAEILRKGRTVAFPTETVYGLGADALNAKAMEKIFRAKNRHADNPNRSRF